MRKIGELKGKPIIEGNPNEIKKNQIHYKESDGGITLSERKEDNTLSSVTSGSGNSEGVKEYYYKVLDDKQLDLILRVCNIKRAIHGFRLETGEEIVYKETAVWHFLVVNNISNPIAFVINDEEPIVISLPDSFARINASYLAKGNLVDRYIKYASTLGQSMTKEEMQSMLEPIVQEMTKEEYESLITQ